MSIRFKNFMTRIGKESEFKPLRNQLLISLKESSENKYKNYPRLIELMKEYWLKYSEQSKISHLLRDHYDELFGFYMNKIFPFRRRGLSFDDAEAPTPVDFKLEFHYRFNDREIEVVKEIIKELELEINIEAVLKRIFIFTISSFGYIVEIIFGRPFAFQFFNIDANQLESGEWEIDAIISGREQ